MRKINETIGFIGCGNMGGAILQGIVQKKLVRASQIFVYDPDPNKTNALRRFGVHVCVSNSQVVKSSQIVVLAIKPQEIYALGKELQGRMRKDHTVISIMAGTATSKIKQLLRKSGSGIDFQVVRAMPNLAAKVGKAITVITSQSKEATKKAKLIFDACGQTLILSKEVYFNLVTAVSGSGPAYFFLLMESLYKFAEVSGLSEADARKLVVQTAVGAAELARLSDETPEELRKQVTSKGGTTHAAISHLLGHNINKTFAQAWQRALNRAQELSKG